MIRPRPHPLVTAALHLPALAFEPRYTPARPRRLPRLVRGAARLLILAIGLRAGAAAAFSEVFFFGDSLSDTGNACLGLIVHPGYAPGRCSNGEVWTDRLAAALGFAAVPSSQFGNNFANGGDTTDQLDEQIALFAVLELGTADPNALYAIWIGANDVLGMPSSPSAMQEAVDRVREGIGSLRDLGAREFLVLNLPDVGRAFGSFSFPEGSGEPFAPDERDAVTLLSLDFNARLAAALDTLTGVTVHRLDVFALVEEIFAEPGAFGFSLAAIDTTSDDTAFGVPCLTDLACATDPQGPVADTFILFDALHPTTAAHAVIGDRAVTRVPEPEAPGQGLVALLTALGLAGRRRRGHRQIRACPDSGARPSRSPEAGAPRLVS